MKFVHTRIVLFTLLLTFSMALHGQDMGNVGFRAGVTMPNGILGTLLKPGNGFGIQFNSTYTFQVRKRFTIDYANFKSSGASLISENYDNTIGGISPAIFTIKKLSRVDASYGLDYKIFPEKLPWFYCGPEVLIGGDAVNLEYVSMASGGFEQSSELLIHTAYKLNFGYEKSFGPMNIFGEYSIMRMVTEYYDINAQNIPNGGIYHFINHKFTVGIKF